MRDDSWSLDPKLYLDILFFGACGNDVSNVVRDDSGTLDPKLYPVFRFSS